MFVLQTRRGANIRWSTWQLCLLVRERLYRPATSPEDHWGGTSRKLSYRPVVCSFSLYTYSHILSSH